MQITFGDTRNNRGSANNGAIARIVKQPQFNNATNTQASHVNIGDVVGNRARDQAATAEIVPDLTDRCSGGQH